MILKIRKIFEQCFSDIFMTIKTASRISSVVECLFVEGGGSRVRFPGPDSLPADVRWGSVVTHSFISPWGRNECMTTEPQRTSAGRLRARLILWC